MWYEDEVFWLAAVSIVGWAIALISGARHVRNWWVNRGPDEQRRVEAIVDAKIGRQISDVFFNLLRTQEELEKRMNRGMQDLETRGEQADIQLRTLSESALRRLDEQTSEAQAKAEAIISDMESRQRAISELLMQTNKISSDLTRSAERAREDISGIRALRSTAEALAANNAVREIESILDGWGVSHTWLNIAPKEGWGFDALLEVSHKRIAIEFLFLRAASIRIADLADRLESAVSSGLADLGLIVTTYEHEEGAVETPIALRDCVHLIHIDKIETYLRQAVESGAPEEPDSTVAELS